MKITNSEIELLASEFGVDYAVVKSIILTESSGSGFTELGIKIQFEPGVFKKLRRSQKPIGTWIRNGVERQKEEWAAYESACLEDKYNAIMSTSWGMGQVMGFNFKAAGYSSPEEMVADFKLGELNQCRGMMNFCKSCGVIDLAKLIPASKDRMKIWAKIARIYNGPGYGKNKYDQVLENNYLIAKKDKI